MTATAVLVGVVTGVVLGWLLLRHRVDSWARRQLERWQGGRGAVLDRCAGASGGHLAGERVLALILCCDLK